MGDDVRDEKTEVASSTPTLIGQRSAENASAEMRAAPAGRRLSGTNIGRPGPRGRLRDASGRGSSSSRSPVGRLGEGRVSTLRNA